MSRNICSQLGTLAVVPFLWRGLVAAIASTVVVTASPAETYSTYRVLYVEDIPDRIISDQIVPLDAFGYLGGLLEARFYEPHSTTNDPRHEIQDAASLYGLDLAMMMSIAKVESDFNPGARTGSYKGLFQLSDYEFNKYGDGSIWDARDNARAAAHMFLVQAEMFRGALGHYPDYAERYMVHQQGIQGATEHYAHPERAAWQSMCATDEGLLKGEKWCKRCIWGNLLPKWKRAFGSVESIHSGDFIDLWTGRIDHLANRYSAASSGVAVNPNPKINTRRSATLARSEPRGPRHRLAEVRPKAAKTIAGRARPTLARSERRAPQPSAAELRARAAKTVARRARPLSADADTSSNDGNRTARSPIKPRRAISGSQPVQKRLQKQAAVVPR
jgi:Transglycosylase SLT domain